MMKLEEAIKSNELLIINLKGSGLPYPFAAIQLGIETMKRFKLYRYKPDPNAWRLLPGETE